ncbi:MAG: aldehyde dehydrogenase family protein [Solirubrobacteraceae bacterium]|nr:aldehyde dehydrogenase family protein [Solirubrobacteraceae bacterium]
MLDPAVLTDAPTDDRADAAVEHAVENPADGSVAGRITYATPDEVDAVAARLRAAQPAWQQIGPRRRGAILARYSQWLDDHRERLEALLVSETGKSAGDASIEIPMVQGIITYYGGHAEAFLAPERRGASSALTAAKKVTVEWHPRRLVGIIAPWNYPLANALMDAIPALTAGCAVLLKPSEVTPLVAAELARGWSEIGAPDVFAVVQGAGETGAALIDRVDMVQFTGSSRTGAAVAAQAAARLIPCSLELGGKDPMIVLEDADLDRAANGAVWGAMFNAGQTCVSVERVYVHESVYDGFVERVVAGVQALRQGAGSAGDPEVGALADERQLAIVRRHVDEAVGAGARALTGGRRRPGPGTFFEPTVLVDVDHSMSCMTEETFGPTLPIMPFRDEEEAIRLANDSPYGLSATVWTRDAARARRIASRLEVGAVNVNDVIANLLTMTAPHGGAKTSGIGHRFGGASGVQKYCRATAVVETRMAPRTEPLWYAAGPRTRRTVMAVMRAYARLGRRRLARGDRG